MVQIKVVPLGAGQDVGKSCILVTIGGKNIMMDCGMHPGKTRVLQQQSAMPWHDNAGFCKRRPEI